MTEEAFGDALRALAEEKLHREAGRRGLGAQLQRLIEMQGFSIDATLVNRWLRNEVTPPLDSPYLAALKGALKLSGDEYDRLYRAAARSRGAALPMLLARPAATVPPPPTDSTMIATPDPTPAAHQPAANRRREFWLLLATAILAALCAVVLVRIGELRQAASPTSPAPNAPGGKWITPAPRFVVTGDTLRFAARAYPSNPNAPPVAAVFFTATWQSPDGGWRIACRASAITPGTPDTYECEWSLTPNVPNGPISVSFDVYDTSGNVRNAPNDLRRGEVRR